MRVVILIVCLLLPVSSTERHLDGLWASDSIRSNEPLWNIMANGSVALASNLNNAEKEQARKTVVNMLAQLYQQDLLPFRTKNYARTKGVLDRVPLEHFMTAASTQLGDGQLENCLEWGPFFTRWPGVTQPYMKKFKAGTQHTCSHLCKRQWTFFHDAKNPRVRNLLRSAVFGELDRELSEQQLDETMQYVVDPYLSARVLFDLVKPGGHLVYSSPFMQTIMPYPTGRNSFVVGPAHRCIGQRAAVTGFTCTACHAPPCSDYFRFTAEGNEKVLEGAGFKVVKSFVGGDDFWSICWIMHCGVSDLSPEMLKGALSERGSTYSHNSYILSAQLLLKPLA
ncbi:hypothetical protein QJQ45_004303 [Haematococcus lacustris]|nr:hypothetical protein QJQ45_004303 [Haematococcus lacustris]